MNIVFVCKQDYHLTYSEMADYLTRKHGCRCVAVTYNTRTEHVVRKQGKFAEVYNFPGFMRKKAVEYSDIQAVRDKVEQAEKRFGGRLGPAWSSDRTLFPVAMGTHYIRKYNYGYDHILRMILGSIQFWEELFDREHPDIVLGEIGNLNEYVGHFLAEERGAKYAYHMFTRILSSRLLFTFGLDASCPRLDELHHEIKDKGTTVEEKKWASDFLDKFIKSKAQPSYMKVKLPFMPDFGRIASLVKEHIEWKRIPGHSEDMLYMLEDKDNVSLFDLAIGRIGKMFSSIGSRKYYSAELPEKYFFFPLHVQPEISTLAFAPYHDNQLMVIENICKALPAGYRLVVKDHPIMVGRRLAWFYKALRRIPNVVIVNPLMHSHEVIEGSAGVVVLTGTVGLEAVLYGKPSIILGNAYFRNSGLLYPVGDYHQLPSVFQKALYEFRFDQSAVEDYLVALKRASFRGTTIWPDSTMQDDPVEMVWDMAEALLQECRR